MSKFLKNFQTPNSKYPKGRRPKNAEGQKEIASNKKSRPEIVLTTKIEAQNCIERKSRGSK
jgi:hypothetical protein